MSWSLSDASQLSDLGSNPISEPISGLYRAEKVRSTFQIQPLRQHNELIVTCSLNGSTTVSGDATLQIKCKCLIIAIKCRDIYMILSIFPVIMYAGALIPQPQALAMFGRSINNY